MEDNPESRIPEDEPYARLEMNGGEVLMTPDNGYLFTFVGKTALSDGTILDSSALNHVFVRYNTAEDGREIGSYIFSHNQAFQALADYMQENGFTAHVNLREVAECDLDAYENSLANEARDLDFLPDDWS